ncbi:MAG TPA: DUF6714 family protein [Blastocatellia bacterium]|nr:DUF6714 family protein [Blastocatellia bacterium]
MLSDAEILDAITQAFSLCERPEHFTNYTHCCECFEHDELLRSRDPETLCMDDVGNMGWDPICFISSEGFAYYFPALARLALSPPDSYWYGPQLFWHLILDGEQNRRWQHFTPEQRRAVATLLEHLVETRAELLEDYNSTDDLFRALEIWSATDDAP